MTVDNISPKQIYETNGTTSKFYFNFNFDENSQIHVLKKEKDKHLSEVVPTTEYVIENSYPGGYVQFNNAPESGYQICICRYTDITQDTPYETSTGFNASVVENSFDKITSIAQELKRDLNLTPKFDNFSNLNIKISNPVPDKLIKWSDDGLKIESSVFSEKEFIDEAKYYLEQTNENLKFSREYTQRSRIWADGNDEEVKGLGGTHSSMVSSGLAYAYANAPEDTPVEDWATSHSLIVQGEKGDKGESAMINGYDVLFIEGGDGIIIEQEMDTLTIKSDVSKAYIDEQIGNISAVLDTINGEVI